MEKIKEISVYPAKIPRRFPFRTSQATQYTVDGIFIEVKDENGYIGTGEAAPREHVTGETFENTFQEIITLSGELLGKDPKYIPEMIYNINGSIGPAAKSSIEMACLDLYGQRQNTPLCDLFENNGRQTIDYCGLIGSELEGKKLKQKARRSIKEAYNIVRVKVGELSIEQDYKRIKDLRDYFGNTVKIWLDANQAWEKDQAIHALNRLNEFNIYMVEQPLDKSDLWGNREVMDNTSIPLMIDESIQGKKDLDNIIENKLANAVNLKFMKLGSFIETRKLVNEALNANIKSYCGGTAVTDIFASYARNVEFSLSGLEYFSSGKPRGASFIEDPIISNMGYAPMCPYALRPTAPGIGAKIDHQIFEKFIIKELGTKIIK